MKRPLLPFICLSLLFHIVLVIGIGNTSGFWRFAAEPSDSATAPLELYIDTGSDRLPDFFGVSPYPALKQSAADAGNGLVQNPSVSGGPPVSKAGNRPVDFGAPDTEKSAAPDDSLPDAGTTPSSNAADTTGPGQNGANGTSTSNQPSGTGAAIVPVNAADVFSYPVEAKKFNLKGTVVLRITVSAEGRVTAVELVKSSGYFIFDDAAKKQAYLLRVPANNPGTFTLNVVYELGSVSSVSVTG